MNLGTKLKFWAPTMSCVGNVQLFVGKLQLSAPLTFLTDDAAEHVWRYHTGGP